MRGLYRLGSAGALAVTAATGLVVSGYVLSAQPALAKGKASYSKEFTAAAKPVQDKVKELEKLRDGGDAAGAKAGANAALPMLDAAMAAVSTDLDKLAATSPFGRVCVPEDVARAVLFFCSSLSEYVTGQRLEVDGGASRMPRGSV